MTIRSINSTPHCSIWSTDSLNLFTGVEIRMCIDKGTALAVWQISIHHFFILSQGAANVGKSAFINALLSKFFSLPCVYFTWDLKICICLNMYLCFCLGAALAWFLVGPISPQFRLHLYRDLNDCKYTSSYRDNGRKGPCCSSGAEVQTDSICCPWNNLGSNSDQCLPRRRGIDLNHLQLLQLCQILFTSRHALLNELPYYHRSCMIHRVCTYTIGKQLLFIPMIYPP